MARLRDVNWGYAQEASPVENGYFDANCGTGIIELTDENIKDLIKGKVLHSVVAGEYAVLIRLNNER